MCVGAILPAGPEIKPRALKMNKDQRENRYVFIRIHYEIITIDPHLYIYFPTPANIFGGISLSFGSHSREERDEKKMEKSKRQTAINKF